MYLYAYIVALFTKTTIHKDCAPNALFVINELIQVRFLLAMFSLFIYCKNLLIVLLTIILCKVSMCSPLRINHVPCQLYFCSDEMDFAYIIAV